MSNASNVAISLIETLSDQRSSEKTYTLRIDNRGPDQIRLHAVTPRLPDAVKLAEIRDTSLVGMQKRRAELCLELSNLVTDHLLLTSEELRARIVTTTRVIFTEALRRSLRPWGTLLALINNRQIISQTERAAVRSWTFNINDSSDATDARARFLGDADEVVSALFEAKATQLARAEELLSKSPQSEDLALIAPNSFSAIGYSLTFPRHLLDARKYVVAMEVAYSTDTSKRLVASVSESVIVSPRPFLLSLIAVLAGLLGVIVSATFTVGDAHNLTVNALSPGEIWTLIQSGQGLSAAILALVLFNIYEHLDIGKRLSLGISWRSALTVGALCGMFSERIILALATIVGGGSG